jgi:hypothetical protein
MENQGDARHAAGAEPVEHVEEERPVREREQRAEHRLLCAYEHYRPRDHQET